MPLVLLSNATHSKLRQIIKLKKQEEGAAYTNDQIIAQALLLLEGRIQK